MVVEKSFTTKSKQWEKPMPIDDVAFRECEKCGKQTEWWLVDGEWACCRCETK